ncbi:breast cancer protein [Apiospora aurea]|uniref:Inclusion body clearance protein IML2 n=1 Tax=Apiospora aurea TaxID=335848 RepID=A0ABR1QN70_9PEZI
MSLRSWFRGATPRSTANPSPSESQIDLQAAEIAQIQDAMTSAAKIMNDDIDGAEIDLKKGSSPYHDLGLGITTFMRSILGFEKEMMAEASKRLANCETNAWNEMKKAQKDAATNGQAAKIHPPGSQYALVHAEAQLMSAVVGVLHESLTEGLKGFYKLRKAFLTLDSIMEAETAYLKAKGLHTESTGSKSSLPSAAAKGTATPTAASSGDQTEDSDLDFVDAAEEKLPESQKPAQYQGHVEIEGKLKDLSIADAQKPADEQWGKGPDSDLFTDPIDAFVHSGANMCFGVLLLIISMVPPAFSRLLSIIGFRGDRERGVTMMWQSTRFDNINGAVAALVLLAYYNGLLAFADILPSEEETERGAIVGYPKKRCAELLAKMRTRYPDSRLWRLEEARGHSNSKDLHGAIKILLKNTDSKMRQVEALNAFELSLNTMFVGDYPATRDNFLRCIELNDWSHSLYYYFAGCAELETYRNAFHAKVKDETQIALHKRKAEELLLKGRSTAGMKRFMARPMPFEVYVSRKISKWEERQKLLGIDFVDAAGLSPGQEMVFLWNGTKKMAQAELNLSEKMLSWDRLTAPQEAKAKIMAECDEQVIRDVCMAAIRRCGGQLDEAESLLTGALEIDRNLFKGPLKDDWAQPAAAYEMAAVTWWRVQRKKSEKSGPASNGEKADAQSVSSRKDPLSDTEWLKKQTALCEEWLEKVTNWGSFTLDARIGMRVQTGKDTLKWYKREQGWESA